MHSTTRLAVDPSPILRQATPPPANPDRSATPDALPAHEMPSWHQMPALRKMQPMDDMNSMLRQAGQPASRWWWIGRFRHRKRRHSELECVRDTHVILIALEELIRNIGQYLRYSVTTPVETKGERFRPCSAPRLRSDNPQRRKT